VVKVAAGECKRQAASSQRTTAKDRIAAKDRLRLSINQLNLVRKRFYSKKVTAAKEPPQRKGHRSESATATKDTKSEYLPA